MQNTVRAAALAVEREHRDSWELEPLTIEPLSPVPRSVTETGNTLSVSECLSHPPSQSVCESVSQKFTCRPRLHRICARLPRMIPHVHTCTSPSGCTPQGQSNPPPSPGVRSDIAVSRAQRPRPVSELGAAVGLLPSELDLFGETKAKVALSVLERLQHRPNGRYVVVGGYVPALAGGEGRRGGRGVGAEAGLELWRRQLRFGA